MDVEDVIAAYERQGHTRGRTASPGSPYYARAHGLRFRLCACSARAWRVPDHVARTARGAHMYVGVNTRRRLISCGPKGYHSPIYRNDRPCV